MIEEITAIASAIAAIVTALALSRTLPSRGRQFDKQKPRHSISGQSAGASSVATEIAEGKKEPPFWGLSFRDVWVLFLKSPQTASW